MPYAGKPLRLVAAASILLAAECTAVSITDDGAPSARYAAEELRDHLNRLNLAEPDMRFSIGLSGDSSLGDDGFEIKSADGAVAVRGGKRGVLYGVYELLERFGGVVWTSPDYTHIPRNGSFSVPMGESIREKPAFVERLVGMFDYRSQQTFAARCRMNESVWSEKFGGPFPPFDMKLWKCHTFLKMVPPEKYYDTHPEYFSLVKGQRLKVRPQLCLTNPDVFELVLSNVLERIEANAKVEEWRRARYYGVSQDDWGNYCECPNCAAIDAREESHAGCIIWFVNKIAEAVEKRHPDVMIETLAYTYGRKPPKNLRPRDNVMVCLCSIECDFSKPMTVSRYQANQSFREDLARWRDIAKNLYLWDYAANWRATPVPYPNLNAYVENIRFYYESGIRYFNEDGFKGDGPSASFADLKGWLGSKLLWNPFQPTEPLMRRFCEAYYGKGTPFVLNFIRFMGEQEIDETKTPLTYAVPLEKMPFTLEFYEKGRELWEKADAAVADENEAIRRHVAWGRFGLEYALAASYAQMGEWRVVNVSSNLATRLDRAEFRQRRESARYCRRMLDASPKAMVSSHLNDFRLKGYLRALAEAEFPDTSPAKAILQDWAFSYADHPKSKTISRVRDEDASDRSAINVSGEKSIWSLICRMGPLLAVDNGTRYRMRARIKVNPPSRASKGGRILSMGLRDRVARKELWTFALLADKATGAYEWYDLGEWTDEGHGVDLHIDTYGATFAIDCVEVSPVSATITARTRK